ncbi:hypothetical protein BS17DRAFT_792011 [Gyrodon lividus]|nr:hypothetical protein BS17DRAFT_792011 [Gyrodon lividus]
MVLLWFPHLRPNRSLACHPSRTSRQHVANQMETTASLTGPDLQSGASFSVHRSFRRKSLLTVRPVR